MLHPLLFRPVFKEYLWGGRRLRELLHKPIPDDGVVAESWEVVDHAADQSIVCCGEFQGRTLGWLRETHPYDLLGKRHQPDARFPLLFKFLDAQRDLSVQVHPNDAQAAKLSPPDLGKTESWIILAAQPGSRVYAGLKQGVTARHLHDASADGTVASLLHEIRPQVGDCIHIPAGTVHAIGAGLLVAEIQQSSDTTYRLFDWNRVDTDGKPRPLHLDAAIAITDFDSGPVQVAGPVATHDPRRVQLVACEKFVVERWNLKNDAALLGGDERFHIISVIAGQATLTEGDFQRQLVLGQTVLLPACLPKVHLQAETATLLDMYVPE